MNGSIEISKEGMIKLWEDIKRSAIDFYNKTLAYFRSLDLYQEIAWGAIGLGFCLVIASVVLFVI